MANNTILHKHITGAIRAKEKNLAVPERHQLRIAKASMAKHCVGLAILGGPNHYESARIIERLSGAIVGIDADCTCKS